MWKTQQLIGILIAGSTLPVIGAPQLDSEIIRQQQRQQQFQQQMQPETDVRLDNDLSDIADQKLPFNEQPCFAINQIALEGELAHDFQFILTRAIKKSGFKPDMCLGEKGIQYIGGLIQDILVNKGYTTTRIAANPQNITEGKLIYNLLPGRFDAIHYDMQDKEHTHVNRISLFANKFPNKTNELFNLYQLEQGLENLKRLPTAEVDMKIVPSETKGSSDVIVKWKQRTIPIRVAFNIDDSGGHSTGRYQGGVTLSVDNPLGLSDLFYVNYNQDLGGKNSETDIDGHKTGSGTNGYALHYSVPFKNWLWSFNRSHYRYHQAIAGFAENYDYNGNSDNMDIGFSRLIYRDNQRKTNVGFKLWRRESHNFINDAEIDVQARRTGGWQINLDHREYIGSSVLNLGLSYKRGTGTGHSIAAPEEAFNEGTSRMKIITADLSLFKPFKIGKQNFNFDTSWHGQWNKTPLITQDQLSIGGRYTVRGFDGELSLMAPRGWYWQNNIAWSYQPQHQIYLGADLGHIATNQISPQLGKTLAGAVIGLKGQFKVGGMLSYDVFAGKPLYKPQYFKTAKTTGGFSLNYAF